MTGAAPELQVGMLHGGQVVTAGGGIQVARHKPTAAMGAPDRSIINAPDRSSMHQIDQSS